MLAVQEIDVFIQASHILRRVSLEVREREVVCLVGRNGAGKTTTLRTIMGYHRPRGGGVLADVVRPPREDDLAALDDVETRGKVWHVVDIGLGDQDGMAALGDLGEAFGHRRDDGRREPLEGLVEEEHVGVEGKRPRDGEHLSLTP